MPNKISSTELTKKSFKLILLIFSTALSSTFALADTTQAESQKKILPYFQVDGEFDNRILPTVAWLDNEKIIYSKPLIDIKSATEVQADKVIFYDDKAFQVVTLNINTNKTEIHKNGLLLGLVDGIATIRTAKTSENIPPQTYSELLKGPLGKEVAEIFYDYERPKTSNSPCYENNTLDATMLEITNIPLSDKYGCVRGIKTKDSPRNMQYTYLSADGRKVALPVQAGDSLYFANWIDWLNSFLFADVPNYPKNVEKIFGTPSNKPNMYLLTPAGDLKLIDINKFGYSHLRPTRAGIIGANNAPPNKKAVITNGLYLLSKAQKTQITEGNSIKPVVSPDGCKFAYYASYTTTFTNSEQSKLRVIDICKELSVSADANPFL